MTQRDATAMQLLATASESGCIGVELRNDLGRSLFDGKTATDIADAARQKNLRILGLTGLTEFNNKADEKEDMTVAFIATAAAVGAETVTLCPWRAQVPMSRAEQVRFLTQAIEVLQPILEDHEMVALIEANGFANSSLRYKEDIVTALDARNRPACFKILHDTFHHFMTGDDSLAAELTGMVHLSAVADPTIGADVMADTDRVLVGENDRTGAVDQLRNLILAGYEGPISIEAHAPAVRALPNPAEAIKKSIGFVTNQLTG